MSGNVCLLFCVLYGSVPRHKIFFCCFEIYKLFQNLLRKWQSKKFWKLSRIKHQQNTNKKTEPLIEYWLKISDIHSYIDESATEFFSERKFLLGKLHPRFLCNYFWCITNITIELLLTFHYLGFQSE